jgi:hypothetical protein
MKMRSAHYYYGGVFMNRVFYGIIVSAMVVAPQLYTLQEVASLGRLSRQCIKIWRMMSDLVEQRINGDEIAGEKILDNDILDKILCSLVRVRDMIIKVEKQHIIDIVTVKYVESSLDCIESYSYDLMHCYPGSWSTVIQDQVARVQEEYIHYIFPLITR